MVVGQLVNTCALYGGSGYTTGWLGVNYLVIIAGFAIIAFVYMLSKFMPANVRGKLGDITRIEIIELIISAIIITALIAVAAGACGVSTVVSQSVTHSSLDPFQFSDYYIGNLTFNTGLSLLTNIYALSIDYAIDSNLLAAASGIIGDNLIKTPKLGGVVQVSFPLGFDLSIVYGIMSTLFLTVFAPLVVLSLGMLFVQWLTIPVIQATAFVIVLPIAIAMRSIAYAGAGPGLRQAANSILAIAIAAYIVYPLMVSFSPCIVSWIYGKPNCLGSINPAAPSANYTVGSLSPQVFSSLGSSQVNLGNGVLIQSPAINSLLGSALGLGLPALDPTVAFTEISTLINQMAQFMFTAVFLFAMDIIITVAFAVGLYKALNAGLERASPFWSNL